MRLPPVFSNTSFEAVKVPMVKHLDGFFTFPEEVGGIVYEQNYYALYSAQLHTDSEHSHYGRHTLFELQLFHKMAGRDQVLAVSVRLQPPPPSKLAPDPVKKVLLPQNQTDVILKQLLALGEQAPGFSRPMMHFLDPSKTNLWNALNLNEFYRGGTFWEYAGSLTRPPCSETAIWLVKREAVSLSPRQAQLLYSQVRKSISPKGSDNRREVMPLGDRQMRVLGVEERRFLYQVKDEKAPSVEDFVPVGPNPREDRLERLNGYAQAAMEASNEADMEGQKLDYRVRTAAYVHAKELAPYLMRYVPPPKKPKFDAYTYAGYKPEIDAQKVAQSMAKAVGSMAASALKGALDKMVIDSKKASYNTASSTIKAAMAKPPPSSVKVNMFGR